jgi:hypothetical protein
VLKMGHDSSPPLFGREEKVIKVKSGLLNYKQSQVLFFLTLLRSLLPHNP